MIDDHGFGQSREQLAIDIQSWMLLKYNMTHRLNPDTLNRLEAQSVLSVEDAWIQAEIRRDEATLLRVIDDRFVLNSNDGTL